MINPFNNEYYGIAAQDENVVLITTEATTILSKEEARLFGRALIAVADRNEIEAGLLNLEAERAVNSVGSYYSSDGTLMNADGTRSIFDDVDK